MYIGLHCHYTLHFQWCGGEKVEENGVNYFGKELQGANSIVQNLHCMSSECRLSLWFLILIKKNTWEHNKQPECLGLRGRK